MSSRCRAAFRRPLVPFAALLAIVGVVSAGFAAPVALGDSCDRRINPIFDGGGYIFDFGARPGHYGSPVDGGANGPGGEPPGPVSTNDSWDDGWGNVWVFSPGADLQEPAAGDRYLGPEEACSFALGGQEIAYPLVRMHGLEVQHRWYVDPGALHGARILTVLHNPGSAPVGAVVVQGNPRDNSFGLGSDSETTPRVSSDGTGVFSSSSFWGVTTDEEIPAGNPDPALAHVWDGQGGAMRASEVVLGDGTRLAHDVLYWDWKVTVPPGGTRAFISYEVQAAVRSRDRDAEIAQAVAQAKARERQSLTSLYIGMSPAEIAATMNWPRPIPTALIAPVASANAATPVRLSAGGSTGASEMPRCEIAGYAWIADGSPIGAGATLSRFFGPGEHRVTLTVSNDCGGSQSTKLDLEVAPGLKLGKLRLNRRAATARLGVSALGPGVLTLAGKGVRRQVIALTKAGNASLAVKPIGRALRSLAKTGRVRLRLNLALQPPGGPASRLSRTVTLRLLG